MDQKRPILPITLTMLLGLGLGAVLGLFIAILVFL